MIVFISFILQNLDSFFSLTFKNDWEYLDLIFINLSVELPFIFNVTMIAVILNIFSAKNYVNFYSDNDFKQKRSLICYLLSFAGAGGAVVAPIFVDELPIAILLFVFFYCIYVAVFFSQKPPTSFYEIAASCYILALIFNFYFAFVYSCQPKSISKHVALLHSIVASIVAQTVFTVLLFVGIFWKGEFCDDNFSLNTLVRSQISYTNMSSSHADINDKTNK